MNITGTTKGNDKEIDKGDKPLNSVKNDIEKGKIKQVKSKNPAKQREQSEQPVHPIKKAPKDQ
ncbi:hypothetical protein [Nubsella zeaxanthinifaciens]|jgi:hypothetical protein|uniref:hypothetical protein n=1 Tax=Nubsella zeaxanthinifaciens TaxID=392412 RepID=UPI000DE3E486|nr:hypothetical protein [Nubsella zeaxanthinifaciens]